MIWQVGISSNHDYCRFSHDGEVFQTKCIQLVTPMRVKYIQFDTLFWWSGVSRWGILQTKCTSSFPIDPHDKIRKGMHTAGDLHESKIHTLRYLVLVICSFPDGEFSRQSAPQVSLLIRTIKSGKVWNNIPQQFENCINLEVWLCTFTLPDDPRSSLA
jgi:hypothetical protein